MKPLAVLVLEQDAQARELLDRFDPAAFSTCFAGRGGGPWDVVLCALPEQIPALLQAANGAPVVALCADDAACRLALAHGADEAFAAQGSVQERAATALVQTAALAQMRAALAASLEELEQQRSALLQLSTLKSDLIATLAHDIKGPLTSIAGFAELLEEGYLEGADAVDAAKTIRTNAQRLAALANDILALSRVERGELELADDRVNLRDVLQTAIAEVSGERTIDAELLPETAHVRGDADRLRQVFDNLLRNAIKYSPGGEPVRVVLTQEAGRFVVRVSDRGIGVPPEEMSKLFQRFGRASNARKSKIAGTGVGLFIVKTIVERHGGTVNVESALGSGSTFAVGLADMADDARPGSPRVVVVAEDPRLRRFTAYELRSRGFRVREAPTLTQAAQEAHDGDVVLIDAGLASAADARAAFGPGYRLIGVGAAARDGYDATLSKPFLIGDLIALLRARPERPQ